MFVASPVLNFWKETTFLRKKFKQTQSPIFLEQFKHDLWSENFAFSSGHFFPVCSDQGHFFWCVWYWPLYLCSLSKEHFTSSLFPNWPTAQSTVLGFTSVSDTESKVFPNNRWWLHSWPIGTASEFISNLSEWQPSYPLPLFTCVLSRRGKVCHPTCGHRLWNDSWMLFK